MSMDSMFSPALSSSVHLVSLFVSWLVGVALGKEEATRPRQRVEAMDGKIGGLEGEGRVTNSCTSSTPKELNTWAWAGDGQRLEPEGGRWHWWTRMPLQERDIHPIRLCH